MPDLPTTTGIYAPTVNSCTLTVNLDIGERNRIDVNDGTGLRRGGGLILVDAELIYYSIFDPSEPNVAYDLYRGMNGTSEVNHRVGDVPVVAIYSYDKSLLSMVAHLLNLEQRMQDAGF